MSRTSGTLYYKLVPKILNTYIVSKKLYGAQYRNSNPKPVVKLNMLAFSMKYLYEA